MLVKKSAFDVLMNKKKTNNLLDKIKTESDSDSSIIIECVKKSSPKPKFLDKNKNEELHKTTINNTATEVLSSFINVDTSFTLTLHTNQLTTEDTAFLKTIQANIIKQDLPQTIIDTIKLDKLFLNLNIEQHKTNIQEIVVVAQQDDDAEVLEQEPEIKTRTRNKRFSFVDSKRKKNEKKKSSSSSLLVSIIEQSTPNNNTFSRNKQDNSELWTEKYMFKSEDEIVTNSSQFERLKEWLKSWKSIIKNEKKNNDKNAYESGSEYSYDSDGSNAESTTSYKRKFYKNAILLSGPLGCGKTSAVHIVAKQLGFKVFEVNSSSLRCKTQIIQELEGAMNSHHVSSSSSSAAAAYVKPPANDITNMLNKKKRNSNEEANFKIDKFFKSSASSFSINSETNIKINSKKSSKDVIETKNRKKRKISLRKETVLSIHHNKNVNKKYKKDFDESENDCCSESEENSIETTTTINENESLVNYDENCVNIHKESLILFDEVDVVFREDVGFLAAINYFIKKSKKPIILTTNDYYLQEKINLNIEKISFNMPRVDAATKFLKKISKLENYDLDTPSAYKILTDCKCDIRRALNQLQVIISSTISANNTASVTLKKSDDSSQLRDYLSNSLNNINKLNYFENFFFLDQLTKRIQTKNHSHQTELLFKKYDQVLIKDGLSDNSSTSSNTSTFNPFLPINIVTNGNNSQVNTNDTCSFSDKYRLNEFYDEYMTLFNNNLIDFKDWSKYGHVDQFNYSSNVSVNKFAFNSFKSTSSRSMSLDYRPFLQIICQLEEIKQTNNNKRRFLHYLPATSMGLSKEDFSLLSKSSLAPKEIIKKETNRNNDIFSDDILDPF